MKKKIHLPLLVLLIITFFASCNKAKIEEPSKVSIEKFNSSIAKQQRLLADKALLKMAYAFLEKYQSEKNNTNTSRIGVIKVPDDFATIQDAVNAAAEGAQILVKRGIYTESIIINTKGLKLLADNNVVIKGGILIASSEVKIRNFSFDCTGIEPPLPGQVQLMGITVINNASQVLLTQNKILNSYFGIVLDQGVTQVSIFKNQVICNDNTMYNGIRLNGAQNNMIQQNIIQGAMDAGIALFYNFDLVPPSSFNNISENSCKNDGVGIYIDGGGGYNNKNKIRENNLTECSIGMIMDFANNNLIKENTVSNNLIYGILLSDNTNVNRVESNVSLNNGECDLINSGIDNVFIANTTGCTQGL